MWKSTAFRMEVGKCQGSIAKRTDLFLENKSVVFLIFIIFSREVFKGCYGQVVCAPIISATKILSSPSVSLDRP
jgi:hypothetical protein